MSNPEKPLVVYDGAASFDGRGNVTISVDEFNNLVDARFARDRMLRGLQRLSSDHKGVTILATWPVVLSHEQIAVADILVRRLTMFADNLLAGREWDDSGKEPYKETR